MCVCVLFVCLRVTGVKRQQVLFTFTLQYHKKGVFITVPEGTESTAVMMSNRLSALYMKM